MLVLSRKPSQTIQIGPDVILTVLGVSGNTVRLGLEAPPEVPIRRGELHARSEQEFSREALPVPPQPHTKQDLLTTLMNVPASVIHVP